MDIMSAGAARTVTGSCHRLRLGDRAFLVDCGLFQGGRELRARNHAPFPFDPVELEAVLVTHGHLDHVGRLPLLIRQGFRGPIYATQATASIAEVILRDSAKIQAEDHRRELLRAKRAGLESEVEEPLYSNGDVERTLALFKHVKLGETLQLGEGVRATYHPAGHILGSAFIEIEDGDARVVFSGDLGNRQSALQAPADDPPACDVVIVETTYADRNHRDRAATEAQFEQVLVNSIERGGNVLIPAFALERTQAVLYEIRKLMLAGRLAKVPVYLDSPMATRMTKLYQSCANEFREDVRAMLAEGVDPFEPSTLHYTKDVADSKAINDVQGAIILAGSGMMTGGRILHHLKHNLWRSDASLVVVGYQASGTLGRAIVGGAEKVRIYGDTIAVRAGVHTINGFSAHADHDDLRAWLDKTGDARVFVVHGEPEVMNGFATELAGAGRKVTTPELDVLYAL